MESKLIIDSSCFSREDASWCFRQVNNASCARFPSFVVLSSRPTLSLTVQMSHAVTSSALLLHSQAQGTKDSFFCSPNR